MLGHLKSERLLRSMGWMGVAELMSRVSRLLAAVVLARCLGVTDYGVVAIAMTTAELVNVLSRNGIGARILLANEEDLTQVCNQAYQANQRFCLCLFMLQASLAWPIAHFYQAPELTGLIIALAGSYLIYPFAMVQVYRVQRANRMRLFGLASGGQITLDNLCSALLAWLGFGVWSVVLPKLIVAPLWVLIFRYHETWRPSKVKKAFVKDREALTFTTHILLTEIIKTLRGNLDKLLVGHFLGLEALGFYYFAINAGMGLSLSLVTAFNTAVFPHLCNLRQSPNAFWKGYRMSLRWVGMVAILLLGAQAMAAPWYVPLVFGEQWSSVVDLVIILIISAIPRPMAETTGQMLRAAEFTAIDLRWNVAMTLWCCAGLLLAMPYGLYWIALATLSIHFFLIPVYLWWLHYQFKATCLVPAFQGA